jgi:hypothetical protein
MDGTQGGIMSEFRFGDRVWVQTRVAGHAGEAIPYPEDLVEALVVGTCVRRELVMLSMPSAEDSGNTELLSNPYVLVAFIGGADSPMGKSVQSMTVPECDVFRTRDQAARWAQDRIDREVARLMGVHARWGEFFPSAED